jgi:hypothetical protein
MIAGACHHIATIEKTVEEGLALPPYILRALASADLRDRVLMPDRFPLMRSGRYSLLLVIFCLQNGSLMLLPRGTVPA